MSATCHSVFEARIRKELPRLAKEEMINPWQAVLIAGRLLNSLFYNNGNYGLSLIDACGQEPETIAEFLKSGHEACSTTKYNFEENWAEAEKKLENMKAIFNGVHFLSIDSNDASTLSANQTAYVGLRFIDAYERGQKKERAGDIYNQFYTDPKLGLMIASEILTDIESVVKKKFGYGISTYDAFYPLNDPKNFRDHFIPNPSNNTAPKILSQEEQGENLLALSNMLYVIRDYFDYQEKTTKTTDLIPFAETTALRTLYTYLKHYKAEASVPESANKVAILSHFRGRGKPPHELPPLQGPYSPSPLF